MLFGYGNALATIIYVPIDYPTIQQGIDASSDGDTVLVREGVYDSVSINYNGHNITVASAYLDLPPFIRTYS